MAKNSGTSNTTKKQRRESFGWSQAFRDMVVSAINRGQLPVFGTFLVILMLLWKMPGNDVSKLVFDILDSLRRLEFLAYLFLVVVCIGWFIHARVMRSAFSAEAERMGREKSELQRKLASTQFKSSNQL